MPDQDTDETPRDFARQVGEQLRNVRHQQRLSLQAVEAATAFEFKASVLGAYERGERAISVARLQRLATFYRVPVDQLLPRPGGAPRPVPPPAREKLTLNLSKINDVPDPYREMLTRYVAMIQVERQDFNGHVLTIRRDDVEAISRMFGTTSGHLHDVLVELGIRS